jgi:hypothetical protein
MRIIAEGTLITLRISARSFHRRLHPMLHASDRLGTLRVGDRLLRTDDRTTSVTVHRRIEAADTMLR